MTFWMSITRHEPDYRLIIRNKKRHSTDIKLNPSKHVFSKLKPKGKFKYDGTEESLIINILKWLSYNTDKNLNMVYYHDFKSIISGTGIILNERQIRKFIRSWS